MPNHIDKWLAVAGLILSPAGCGPPLRADDFERLEGRALADAPRNPAASRRDRLSVADLLALPTVLRDTRAAPVVVKTDQGNYTRMIVSPGLRKPPGSKRDAAPVLVIERFDTFDAGRLSTRLARGRDLVLFSGFQVDLDSGLVVPNDQGADLRFIAAGPGAGVLETVGGALIYTFTSTPVPTSSNTVAATAASPSAPADFAGRYQLFSDGRWSGLLELKVSAAGVVGGFFRSDTNGVSYDVAGRVAAESPDKAAFKVSFPQAQMDFDARLWSQGKGVIAGLATMRARDYGFFAIREGVKIRRADNSDSAPGFADAIFAGATGHSGVSRRVVALVAAGRFQLDADAAALDAETLAAQLRRAAQRDPAVRVRLRPAAETPFRDLDAARLLVADAGVKHIEIAPLSEVQDAAPQGSK